MDDRPTAERPKGGDPRAPTPADRLTRPPSDRYGGPVATDGEIGVGRGRAIVTAAALSGVGAGAIAILGGVLGIGAGLIVVAALAGWLVAASLRTAGGALVRRTRLAIAVALAVDAVLLGQVGLWVIAIIEGGVLDPISYLGQVFGVLVPAELVASIAAAVWTAR